MRSRHTDHGKRHQHWKADNCAQAAEDNFMPQVNWRRRSTQEEKNGETRNTGNRCARRCQKQRIDGGDGQPCRRQRTAEQKYTGNPKRQSDLITRIGHYKCAQYFMGASLIAPMRTSLSRRIGADQ